MIDLKKSRGKIRTLLHSRILLSCSDASKYLLFHTISRKSKKKINPSFFTKIMAYFEGDGKGRSVRPQKVLKGMIKVFESTIPRLKLTKKDAHFASLVELKNGIFYYMYYCLFSIKSVSTSTLFRVKAKAIRFSFFIPFFF